MILSQTCRIIVYMVHAAWVKHAEHVTHNLVC